MTRALEDKVFPGAVLIVSQDGTIHFKKAFGRANIFTGRRVTLETVFDLGSLTKPLATSLAIMHLVQNRPLSPVP